MTQRDLLEAQVIKHEGLRLKPYLDTVGKLTIGVGRNLTDVGITRDEAEMLLSHDLDRAEADLDRHLPWWRRLDECRQRALVELCFNLGVRGLLGFKQTLGFLEARNYVEAAAGLRASKWATQVGPRRTARIATMIETGDA